MYSYYIAIYNTTYIMNCMWQSHSDVPMKAGVHNITMIKTSA